MPEMKTPKHLFKTQEGYLYRNEEVATAHFKQRANNRVRWLTRFDRSKYKPHQGKQECLRRKNQISI